MFQDEKGDIIPVEEDASNITGREAVMLINTLLIIAGFLDIVFGLPSVIICLRELCDCYNPALLTGTYRRIITLQRNLNLYIPRKGIARPHSNFHIYVSVSDLKYIFPRSAHLFSCSRIGRPIRGIYKSLTET
jgi:hypothetical protein